MHRAQAASIPHRVQAQNFARFAFRNDVERAAAHFAIRHKPLERHTRIDHHLKLLTTKRALDVFGNFHVLNLVPRQQFAIIALAGLSGRCPQKGPALGRPLMTGKWFPHPA